MVNGPHFTLFHWSVKIHITHGAFIFNLLFIGVAIMAAVRLRVALYVGSVLFNDICYVLLCTVNGDKV